MEDIPIPKEPFIIKAIVNGLIATIIIWSFWTPFLVFVASPLMNAMIKGFICGVSKKIPGLVYRTLGPDGFQAFEDNIPNPPEVANNIINENLNTFVSENLVLFVIFGITSLFMIGGSLYLTNYLIHTYNISISETIYFNVLMAFIIILIETIFFVGVTTEYISFNSKTIFHRLSQKLNDTFNKLSVVK